MEDTASYPGVIPTIPKGKEINLAMLQELGIWECMFWTLQTKVPSNYNLRYKFYSYVLKCKTIKDYNLYVKRMSNVQPRVNNITTTNAVKTINFSTIVEFFPDFLDLLLIEK
mgnify:FL=1